mmetsp:Transcript_2982/g.6744  ORF Transcript_2982/g.6744 Transcript_2982/m.6744 type:complete len:80 (+) Transcript_2982:867-1106(+)
MPRMEDSTRTGASLVPLAKVGGGLETAFDLPKSCVALEDRAFGALGGGVMALDSRVFGAHGGAMVSLTRVVGCHLAPAE